MLTKNYKNYRKGFFSYVSSVDVAVEATDFIDTGGKTISTTNFGVMFVTAKPMETNLRFNSIENVLTKNNSSASGGVYFGDGSVEPTDDDYFLSGNIISTLNSSVVKNHVENEDGSVGFKAVYTLTNTGTDNVTISEVAYVGLFSTSSSAYKSILLDRTLLDSPVTIPAGGVGQVTYTVTFNIA